MTATSHAHETPLLDCLGKACPVPVIELAKAVPGLEVGHEIIVVADDPGAKVDIPVWCRMKRHELVAVEQDGAEFRFTVRRSH
ncbi:MAG: aminotransferase [Nitriliruptorales bacterium]|nr:aminotransferase [Nitriliruptorales bacterium]